jgi:hypothetical protein
MMGQDVWEQDAVVAAERAVLVRRSCRYGPSGIMPR